MHILLAEDECVTRESTRITLERRGHKVTAVDNGADAIAAFSLEPFDLVFMDIKMPKLDGLEVARRIRASEGETRVPIIALSGFSTRELPDIDAVGIDAFIEKPFQQSQIIKTLGTFGL